MEPEPDIDPLEGGSEGGGALADDGTDPIAPVPPEGEEYGGGGGGTGYALEALVAAEADDSLLTEWREASRRLGESLPLLVGLTPPAASRSLPGSVSDACLIPPPLARLVLPPEVGVFMPTPGPLELLPSGDEDPLAGVGILPPAGGTVPRLDGAAPLLLVGDIPPPLAGGIPPFRPEPSVPFAVLDAPTLCPPPSVEDWLARLPLAPLALLAPPEPLAT